MRAVIQRVKRARVTVNGETIGSIGAGLLVLLAVHSEDSAGIEKKIADKIINLRIFADDNGKMNSSLIINY
ncbi:hypothetical protein A2303_05400 [Candidatus Falkowbacteria bacterium RIFOXYB2_FULL_47_14]|uniref:D-tyrosyl-tRNA(Tyr) deacylase n=1 Tax=Candidatus Falkowbacteria bacterium RIFOXYA2_FULL_47_19 TaxID=1797994 RepID=A0A1F5SL25_9BACT|nr:MAG: hypothetical protein A2227_02120 [Candidatus Falkowbacteria bacterium RIFOXYA2_FULL_47_19]OGF36909.1 MAG: hypothetical protein A2468_08075 [Candidatus Falkowbacteria bacterium RIFOXYC2_FULL_46_15]OGF43286.1 MAG: hypothetical protein A2303_05400 [Candidatus Falkowbacteria bacterium RIFOXYB2_FULL_47_14]